MTKLQVIAAIALLGSGTAHACEPLVGQERRSGYNARMVGLIQHLREVQPPTIFMGDSLIAGWPEANRREVFPTGSVNFGANGDAPSHLFWRIQQAIPQGAQIKTAVILIGTNGLSSGTSEELVCAIESIVGEVQRRAPGVMVYVLEIPPRGADLARFKDRIEAINRALPSRLASSGAKVVPIHAELLRRSAEDGADTYFRDGLHFTSAGYTVLTEALRAAVAQGEETTRPPAAAVP